MFNGSVVTPPYLLYHDEISVGTTATSGILTCMVEASTPVWRDVSTSLVDASGLMSRLSRTGDPIPNDIMHNGLWSCIQSDRTAFGYVGIYNRG